MPDRKSWEKEWKEVSGHALVAVNSATSLDGLETLRLEYLGRKGRLTSLLKDLKDFDLGDRRELGGPSNAFKEELSAAIDAKKAELEGAAQDAAIAGTKLDLTLPGLAPAEGRLHPLTLVMREMTGILSRMGFSWAEGPHVETDHYNFESLNFPPNHPARDMQDTFYVDAGSGVPGSILLRPQTSPVQIRRMEAQRPPLRIMAPGRVFRHEAVDASHGAVFHQIEGLYVDKGVTMADLKGTLLVFIQSLFGPKAQMRFRPSFFPFTEPSAEVDMQCILCEGSGCPACKRTGWMEVLGAGMVHPNVFKGVDYDPEVWSGFAFGMGVERIAMLKLGITDLRLFYQNDLRFLEQFK
ncbi:MAG: phenylalanine--tRNA ligase subunit alpha [Elusimicrobia bacterium]|nr:phenylalanine--tRNA ligase subunit alpha [Elusimicrobiota bacterium]